MDNKTSTINWIPVEERLPKMNEAVFVAGDGYVGEAWYYKVGIVDSEDIWSCGRTGMQDDVPVDVEYWAEIPESPCTAKCENKEDGA